ncbi:MAG: dihydropyrimidinase, partial [Clostridiales bacterium GWB2_37_7]
MKTLIKNGKIATAGDLFYGDISIVDGIIMEIGTSLKGSYDNEINAFGKLVIPGGVDVHTHFNLHTGSVVARDDFYTGTVAAACGGTTSIVDHMGFGPEGCSLDHQLKVYHKYAKDNAVVDYSFHGVLQHINEDVLKQLEDMVVNQGISSFKAYMTYDYMLKDSDLLRVMERLKDLHGILAVHAENHEIIAYLVRRYTNEGYTAPIYHALSRPDFCEGDAVSRAISLAAAIEDMPLYIVHLSTEAALQHVMRAAAFGERIYAETCPQYLLLNDEKYMHGVEEGLRYILSPPLRRRKNCEALWQGIRAGYIQVV